MSNEKNVRPLTIYIIAGEASGDLLGAHLMRSLKAKSSRPLRFFGVGGERMEAEGLKSLFPYYELSMLGFIEILPYLFNLTARISLTVEDILAKHPDMIISIDVPGFSMRVAKRIRKENLKTRFVHYVAPSVWAYNPERADKCAAIFDHLLALLPFEPPYFEKAGLPCTFVGHPVVVETEPGNGQRFREKYEISTETTLFTLLPGSRKSEVERHMPIFARAVTLLAAQYPNLAITVAVPKNVLAFIAPYFDSCPFRAVIMTDEQDKKDAIAASDIAIVKSGTVALEVALAGVPMIVAYRVNPASAWALKYKMLSKYVNLINILLKQEAIPELLQTLCHPMMIAGAAAQLLEYPKRQHEQKTLAQSALSMLHLPNEERPSDKAADIVLGLLENS